MQKIYNTFFIKGNINKIKILNIIIKKTNKLIINNIISDISPNITGIYETDYYNQKKIINNILWLCKKKLINKGNLIIKIFLGKLFNKILKKIKNIFNYIKIFKPQSSNFFSKEIYIIAKNYNKT